MTRLNSQSGWIRTAAALSQKTAQKQPSGLFLAARLAKSTRAHQKTSTYASTLRFLFCNKAGLHRAGGFEQQQRRPLPAAETGRSCWGCGQQDARAVQGTVQPLGAATRVPFQRGSRNPPAPTKNRNVSKYAAVLFFYSSIFTSPAHQSSWARILFCTISPAGVRARVRPSKVAYPARTQFCTKASCAVENCLPYRVL